jgi:hypothetical protein
MDLSYGLESGLSNVEIIWLYDNLSIDTQNIEFGLHADAYY